MQSSLREKGIECKETFGYIRHQKRDWVGHTVGLKGRPMGRLCHILTSFKL